MRRLGRVLGWVISAYFANMSFWLLFSFHHYVSGLLFLILSLLFLPLINRFSARGFSTRLLIALLAIAGDIVVSRSVYSPRIEIISSRNPAQSDPSDSDLQELWTLVGLTGKILNECQKGAVGLQMCRCANREELEKDYGAIASILMRYPDFKEQTLVAKINGEELSIDVATLRKTQEFKCQ